MVANNPGMVRWHTVYTDVMGSIPTLGTIYYTFVRKRLSYLNRKIHPTLIELKISDAVEVT